MRSADALLGRVAVVATRARIHRCHEHERGGVVDAVLGARNRDVAVLQRLPHHLQNRAIELGQLVKKKDSVVRQRDFSWRGISAATHQGNVTSIRLCGGAKLALLSYNYVFNVPTACRHFSSEI